MKKQFRKGLVRVGLIKSCHHVSVKTRKILLILLYIFRPLPAAKCLYCEGLLEKCLYIHSFIHSFIQEFIRRPFKKSTQEIYGALYFSSAIIPPLAVYAALNIAQSCSAALCANPFGASTFPRLAYSGR